MHEVKLILRTISFLKRSLQNNLLRMRVCTTPRKSQRVRRRFIMKKRLWKTCRIYWATETQMRRKKLFICRQSTLMRSSRVRTSCELPLSKHVSKSKLVERSRLKTLLFTVSSYSRKMTQDSRQAVCRRSLGPNQDPTIVRQAA